MLKVSIIIPVYNTEKYLRKCLDSVCNQTLQDIEIICVNDCSTDDSLEILKEYASNDNRIKIINFTENKGAAVARNTAIEQAKGEYIGFVDSDDYVDLDFYEKLYSKAKETNADISKGCLWQTKYANQTLKEINDFSKIKNNKFVFYYYFTTAIYKSIVIKEKNIRFPEKIKHLEDPFFLTLMVYNSKKITFVDSVKYYYNLDNDTSTTNNKSFQSLQDIINGVFKNLDLFNHLNLSKEDYCILFDNLFNIVDSLDNDKILIVNNVVELKANVMIELFRKCKFPKECLYYSLLKKKLVVRQNTLKVLQKKWQQMLKVSIIIPIYNVEQYLPKCLESVINQTYKNLEIICVNDCSPDGSLKICQGYAQKDSRIKLINREQNGGLSAARNSGLEVASGEYIYFIDSDDYIDSDYIEKMVQMIEKHSVDMVLNTHILQECGDKSKPFPTYSGYAKQLTQGEFVPKEMAINLTMPMIYLHLYKKAFLDKYHLRFPEGYIHEDEYFQCISKIHLDALFVFYGPAYHYLQRENSIMASRKSKIEGYVKIFTLIYEFYKNNKLLDKDTTIKCFRVGSFACIKNEQEFLLTKDYIELISKDFEKCPKASTHAEKYIFNAIKESKTIDEYKAKVGKNAFLTYMTRQRMQQKAKGYKVSIIIPVYNTEKYLRKCLDSVCNQTLQDIEIICVNDCSTDDSLEILKEYASNDNRIKIINFTENKGAAVARNTAIEQAKGEYIGFVDSDDYVDLDFYEKLYNAAKSENAEIAKGKLYLCDIKIGKIYLEDWIDINDKAKENKAHFYFTFTTGLYKRDFIIKHDIKFLQGLIHFEDPYFTIKANIFSTNLVIDDSARYYYTDNAESTSRKNITGNHAKSVAYGANEIADLLNDSAVSKEHYLVVFNFVIRQVLEWCHRLDCSDMVNIIAANGLFSVMKKCKYKQENLEYYFLDNKQRQKRQMAKQIRQRLQGKRNA